MADSINYKQLLLKYIEHVGVSEGVTFINDADRNWNDAVEFTDEEWAALKELDELDYIEDFVNHSCSCHVRSQGPCDICKVLGCEVFDFNHVAMPDSKAELWAHSHTEPIMTLPVAEGVDLVGFDNVQEEGDEPQSD